MFIPLRDESPARTTPYVNYALVAVNTLVFFYELTLPHRTQLAFASVYGTVPSRFAHILSGHGHLEAAIVPLFTSMFLHAGLAHLLDAAMECNRVKQVVDLFRENLAQFPSLQSIEPDFLTAETNLEKK